MGKQAKARFVRQIREARAKQSLRRVDVAEKVGVSYACIYFWETGRSFPRHDNLIALCRTLKLPVAETLAMTGR